MKPPRSRNSRSLVYENMEVYESISIGYKSWRQRPWRVVKVFDKYVKSNHGKRVLDLGSGPCVNGIDLVKVTSNYLICLDISFSMSKLSRENILRNNLIGDAIVADLLYLPLRENSIDIVLSIASLHHIPPEMIKRALAEIQRVMKPLGKVLITTWSWRQLKFLVKQVFNKILEIAGVLASSREFLVPWRTRKRTYYRYYCLYTLRELEDLCRNIGLKTLSSGYIGYLKPRSDNIYVIATKVT